ncbi:MAG: alkene reductase [Alphaproteobacteria bacterium]|nr:MAG: alkene reductase [Alphaproteobacteria bacterium]TAF76076.1 MAG: alkene reductase [Alphaproteobacteria bacterium]
MTTIFDPLTLGSLTLPNRIIMAPLTRGRADAGGIPGAMMAEYYALRADAGLIISEATAITPQGYGWLGAPGIWNDAQMEGWQIVTEAVHNKGGRIFMQLWHMGRISHPDFLGGELPVAPSAIAAIGQTNTPLGKKDYVIPRPLTLEEIKALPHIYAEAAQRAIDAGFDGVEIHAANGYLLDEFIRDGSNQRTDAYGGSIDNRLRLMLEVVSAVCTAIGSDKVGIRFSPMSGHNSMVDSDPVATFSHAAEQLNAFGIAYVHIIEPFAGHRMYREGERVTPHIRTMFTGIMIANGGYSKDLANDMISTNDMDAVSFGMMYIANPDLVTRLRHDHPLNAPNMETLYSGGRVGYI